VPDPAPAPRRQPDAELIPAPERPSIAAMAAARNPRPDPGPLTVDRFEEALDAYRANDPAFAGLLANARPTLGPGHLRLAVGSDASATRAAARLDQIRVALASWIDADTVIEIVVDTALDDTPHTREMARQQAAREAKRQEIADHPLVRQVVERFGGTLERVRLYDAPPKGVPNRKKATR
jgi:hypothetical protein